MATLKQLIECEISDFFAGFGHPGEPETPEEMQSQLLARVMQLLAGLEQEPVAYIGKTMLEDIAGGERHCGRVWAGNEDRLSGESRIPLYAAPQLPQPAVMDEQYQHLSELYHAQEKRLFKIAQRIKGPSFDKYAYSPSQAIDVLESEIFGEREGDGRAAMLQGAEPVRVDTLRDGWVVVPVEPTESMLRASYMFAHVDNTKESWQAMLAAAPHQEVTTGNTTQQFESLGLIVTSDERKMELPRCSKHPETKLQAHPFEQLLSYPPQPVMYCPLCKPSVAEWVARDKKLRAR